IRPGGTVTFTSSKAGTFSSGGTCALPATLTNSCSVSYTPAAGSEGANLVTGTYGGDTDHTGSSGTDTVTGTPRSTLTSLSCSPGSVPVNSPSTCTATVADNDSGTTIRPGGTVTFSGGTGTATAGATCSRPATGTNACSVDFTPSAGSEGSQTLTGSYGGDTNHSGSSGTFSITAQKRSSSTSLTCSP